MSPVHNDTQCHEQFSKCDIQFVIDFVNNFPPTAVLGWLKQFFVTGTRRTPKQNRSLKKIKKDKKRSFNIYHTS